MLLLGVTMVEHGAMRQLPACEAFAELLGHGRTCLEEGSERILGNLVNHDPSERSKVALQRLTGKQSDLAEIISRCQSGDLNLAAVLLNGSHQNAITDDTQGLQDRAGVHEHLAGFVI